MTAAPHNPGSSPLNTKAAKALMLLAAVTPLLTLVAWPLGVFVSLFAFDAPGAAHSIPTLLIVFSVWLYRYV